MSAAAAERGTLRFQVGARTLASIPRRLRRVSWTLADALSGAGPAIPALADADGYLVTSVPAHLAETIDRRGCLIRIRQRYTRYWCDLTIGEAAWRSGLSANARSTLKRKARRLAEAGEVAIRGYRGGELATFHARARPLSARTYQERLLGSGLPDTPAFHAEMAADAAADTARAWLLSVDGVAVAYLYCTARDGSLLYAHVGHDPAWNALSPGSVLHAHAMADLFAERRFARFDFTEGEGQHKRQFATGGVECVDLLMLRPTIANRAALAALGAWDGAMAWAKRRVRHPALKRLADAVRR